MAQKVMGINMDFKLMELGTRTEKGFLSFVQLRTWQEGIHSSSRGIVT